MKKSRKNDIALALSRELKGVKLSEQTKRDILYAVQHAPRRADRRPLAYAVWVAAAMVVLLGASLLISGGQVKPDIRRDQPLNRGNGLPVQSSPTLTEGETQVINAAAGSPENTMVPPEMTDLFLRYECEQIVPISSAMPVVSDEQVLWGTRNGTYYHLVSDCSGMKNAVPMTRSEVSKAGKMPCPVCIAFVTPTPVPVEATPELTATPRPTPVPAEATPELTATPMLAEVSTAFTPAPMRTKGTQESTPMPTPTPTPIRTEGTTESTPRPTPESTPIPVPLYWGTEHGIFYHIYQECSGMKNAVVLTDLSGKRPCPECISPATFTPMPTEEAVYEALSTPEPMHQPMNAASDVIYNFEVAPDPTEQPMDAASDVIYEFASSTPEPAKIPFEVIYDAQSDREPETEAWWYQENNPGYYHTTPDCSGLRDAVETDDITGMYPCPRCVPGAADYETVIDLTRYTTLDGEECIMELEYISDQSFSFIEALPDPEGWYVDDVDAESFVFGDYLAGRISDDRIAQLEAAYIKNGQAGFEIREVIAILNGVETQLSGSIGDVPSGSEYWFGGIHRPEDECVVYRLDKPYEGDEAEVSVIERNQQWYFDGENIYRRVVPDNTVTYTVHVEISEGGKAIVSSGEPTGYYFNTDVTGITLDDMRYVIVENDEGYDLSQSALICTDGSAFEADMITDPTIHKNSAIGWRYPIEEAEQLEKLLISDGERSVEVYPDNEETTIPEQLRRLLTSCGVTDPEMINSTVERLILMNESGEILAMSNHPYNDSQTDSDLNSDAIGEINTASLQSVREVLRKTGLTDHEIAANYMINSVIAILTSGKEAVEEGMEIADAAGMAAESDFPFLNERLVLLLASCGVTDADTVSRTVKSLIVLGENGDILAVSGQPVLETLLETGLTEKEIADGGMVEEIITILSEAKVE